MLSALIFSVRGYPAMLLAEQLVHYRYVIPGPLVLRNVLLKFPAPTVDKDQTVSRRFEPSSRTALIGEQPNPWDLLQPQDVMSRPLIPLLLMAQTIPSSNFPDLGFYHVRGVF